MHGPRCASRTGRLSLLLATWLLTNCLHAGTRRVERARLRLGSGAPPAAYLPLSDGSLLLLDARRRQLHRFPEEGPAERIELGGEDFPAARTRLVEAVEESPGRILLLDAGAGTVWRATLGGDVIGRFGELLAPVSMARGADGRVWVVDAGRAQVLGFRRGRLERRLDLVPGVSPFATEAGHLPVAALSPDRRQAHLELHSGQGSSGVTHLEAPAGYEFLSVRVMGVHHRQVWLEALLTLPEEEDPVATRLVRVELEDGRLQGRTSIPAPRLGNLCMDCGPDYRVGPRGRPWFYALRGRRYHVFRLRITREGGR